MSLDQPIQSWSYWKEINEKFGGLVPIEYEVLVDAALKLGLPADTAVQLVQAAKADADTIKNNKGYWDN